MFHFDAQGATVSTPPLPVWRDLNWEYVAAVDFDHNGYADILVKHQSANSWRIFSFSDTGVTIRNPDFWRSADFEVIGTGEFTGGGFVDLLMRHKTLGSYKVYHMDDNWLRQTPVSLPLWADLGWATSSIGDYDRNGYSDVLLRSSAGTWRLFSGSAQGTTRSRPALPETSHRVNLAH